jgi:ribosome-binding factor A
MAKPSKPSGPNQRQLRIGELIRHALADLLSRGDIHDEVLAKHVITVPEVRLSTDLKLATCFVMPLGGGDVKPVLKALNDHKRYIRGEIAHRVNLKFAPDIRFLQDESFAEAERVDAILYSDKVRQDILKQPLRINQDEPAFDGKNRDGKDLDDE